MLGALLFVASAAAHFDASGTYTHGGCPATADNRVDPINVVFTSWGTWGRAASQIETHADWADTSGSSQTFLDHGGCYSMHDQRASGAGTRFHVRVRGQHSDAELGWTATGDEPGHSDSGALEQFPFPCST